MKNQKYQWFRIALQIKGSVIPSILNRVFWCGIFGVFISILYYLKIPVQQTALGSVVSGLVLGLLLVFRTNTAYERFWEGRKFWGQLINNTRSLTSQIWVAVAESEAEDKAKKEAALYLVAAFPVALKLHLRSEPVNSELEQLMPPSRYFRLKTMDHPPLAISFWIRDYLQEQHERNCLNIYQLTSLQELVSSLVDILGGCERILRTPIPLAYSIHLKQLVLLYCLCLPFQLVKDLNWWTGPIVALISFTLFGIEEIGEEIENPFGYDPNDMPLDGFCATIRRNVEEIMTLTPSVNSYKEESKMTSVE